MSVLTLAEARALIATGLGDADFQVVIDREEAWLARRIGALTGSRVQTLHIRPWDADAPLWLRRPTAAATVTDAGVAVAGIRLLNDGWRIEKTTGSWTGPVAVTSMPNDTDEVKRVVVELLRLAVTSSPYDAERLGDYSYQRSSETTPAAQRAALVRDLKPPISLGTIHLRSPFDSQRVGAVTS